MWAIIKINDYKHIYVRNDYHNYVELKFKGTATLNNISLENNPKVFGIANNTFQRFFLHIRFLLSYLKKRDDEYGKYAYNMLKDNMLNGIINNQRLVLLKMIILKGGPKIYNFHKWICDSDDSALKKVWPK